MVNTRVILRSVAKMCSRVVVTGYKEYCWQAPSRRALISYLTGPLLVPRILRPRVQFSNKGIAQEIPRVLNELGFEVDIVDYRNTNWKPTKQYDLFIGHANVNYTRLSASLSRDVARIYFSTGMYWSEHNWREAERIEALYRRRGVLLRPDRKIIDNEDGPLEDANGIIAMGNTEARASYHKFDYVYPINNASYPANPNKWRRKDYASGRSHFLFFSGAGNVHKGLDLLLDAFRGLNVHLHVCQEIDPDFMKLYRRELTDEPNIHLYGHIPMRGRVYNRLVELCDWVISPSCSEGSAGSVVECMAHGLIPILTDANTIDLGTWGLRIPAATVSSIREQIVQAPAFDPDECRARSEKTLDVVESHYRPSQFRQTFANAVREILARVGDTRSSLVRRHSFQDRAELYSKSS